jgi:glycerol uptake facilitator-like aquaporin
MPTEVTNAWCASKRDAASVVHAMAVVIYGARFMLLSLLLYMLCCIHDETLSLLLLWCVCCCSICIYMAANISGGHLNPAVTMR